ncbi:hypothetical protein O4H61_03430 [Roseovarius aestuarii]|nr:hypothetical protein [Roseovarius aestuarii]
MTLPHTAAIAHALEIVTRPDQFGDQMALREFAWRQLVEARGGTMHPQNLPMMRPAEPGRPACGVAGHLARRLCGTAEAPTPSRASTLAKSTLAKSTLAASIHRAQPAIRAAIARRRANPSDHTPPTGGTAA